MLAAPPFVAIGFLLFTADGGAGGFASSSSSSSGLPPNISQGQK